MDASVCLFVCLASTSQESWQGRWMGLIWDLGGGVQKVHRYDSLHLLDQLVDIEEASVNSFLYKIL